ncbi:uncharacterized protein LOC125622343 [Caretta caretta]|uniref:uncharacterized protein LOC125622343 n=1 Tax=Caretta caretta TaxID=8467 RepID=UPI003F4C0793
MDVEALYTNIPYKDGLQAVRNSIPDNVTANLVAELCDFVLTHNCFTFGDNVYLQISGTAMGTCMAPQYANIFMADLEQHFLSSCPLMPLLYLHYIDDIFIIWTHGKEALEEFYHDFNNFHPTINLSLDQSTQEIHFLDTTVLISDGHINTTPYRKPTDRYAYLHASSFHPDHNTRSIVYSQALRYNHICSNPSDRDKHRQDLYQAFLQLHFSRSVLKKQIDRARRVPRSHLLQDRPNKENNNATSHHLQPPTKTSPMHHQGSTTYPEGRLITLTDLGRQASSCLQTAPQPEANTHQQPHTTQQNH